MSAWSDWKCGAISYDDYRSAMEEEARRDEEYLRERERDELYGDSEDDGDF